MREHTFRLHKLHCKNCEHAIRTWLIGLDGVTSAEADRRTNTVTVTVDDTKVSRDAIAARLEEVGYLLGR